MKVLTQLTASGGIDVASNSVDTIKLGSANTENNDATVDNLTVWANADFKNNVTLGSSAVDNTLVNSKLTASNSLYVSGNLYVNGVNITASSGGSGGGLSEQDISGALTIYAKSSDVSSSFVDNSELTSAIANFPTRTEVTGATNTVLTTVAATYATKTGVTGALSSYATLSGISSSFVTNTNATSSLARLAASNIFTANQIITGSLSTTSDININNIKLGLGGGQITSNLALGTNALVSGTTSITNIAIGHSSLFKQSINGGNTAIGHESLFSCSSGAGNIAVGNSTLYKTTTANYNIGIGPSALYANTGESNIAIGYLALDAKAGGGNNVVIGTNALGSATTATNNIALGHEAGFNASETLTSSVKSIFIGSQAGASITSIQNGVIIGGNNGSTIDRTTGSIIISDGTGNIRVQADSTGLVTVPGNLSVNGNTILGNAAADTTTTSGSLSVLNNIKFPAVQVASADANTLDDYEEGSWTPAFSGSTTTNFSYASRNAKYTKIGNRVYINGIMSLSSTGSSAGTLTIGNLPFTSDTPLMSVFSGDMYNFSATITGSINCGLGSTTSLVLYKYVGGNRTTVSVTELKNNSEYVFSGFYTA